MIENMKVKLRYDASIGAFNVVIGGLGETGRELAFLAKTFTSKSFSGDSIELSYDKNFGVFDVVVHNVNVNDTFIAAVHADMRFLGNVFASEDFVGVNVEPIQEGGNVVLSLYKD